MYTPEQLLNIHHHRDYDFPKNKWLFYQEWNNAIFLHWKIDKQELIKYIPEGLELDSINNNYWISVVAFCMNNIHLRFTPQFRPISNFNEINIRTYVKNGNKKGVYFLSLECDNRFSTFISKKISGFPYRFTHLKRDEGVFKTNKFNPDNEFQLKFEIGNEIQKKSEIDYWLTERYTAFNKIGNQIKYYEIHHIEWPLQSITLNEYDMNYKSYPSILNQSPDLCHYSKGVQVLAWSKREM